MKRLLKGCLSAGLISLALLLSASSVQAAITLKTSEKTIKLKIEADGNVTITGVKDANKFVNGQEIKYTVESPTISIEGKIKGLECTFSNITELQAANNKDLEKLACNNNKLVDLDLSGCTALVSLNCYNNRTLKSLNVSGCTSLKTADARNCALASLDLSQCKKLETLDCPDNWLSTIDLKDCTALKKLKCSNNRIAEIDFSSCKDIEEIFIFLNRLRKDKMRAMVESLPTKGTTTGILRIINEEGDSNICTKEDVAIATKRNWKVQKKGMGLYTGSDLPGEGTVRLKLSKTVDKSPSFLITARSQGDYTVDGAWAYGSYTVHYIPDAQDIAINGTLNSLVIGKGAFESLDASACPSATQIDCAGNGLESITFAQQGSLTKVSCYSNQLRGKKMREMILSLPDLSKSGTQGELIVIFKKSSSGESNVCTKEDVAEATKRGWKVYDYNDNEPIEYAGSVESVASVENTELQLYPNPASDLVHMEGVAANARVALYTMDGRMVLRLRTDAEGKLAMPVADLPRATYVVKAGKLTRKLVLR